MIGADDTGGGPAAEGFVDTLPMPSCCSRCPVRRIQESSKGWNDQVKVG